MMSSKYFEKKCKKLIFSDNPEPNLIIKLREEFSKTLGFLPPKMTEEIVSRFFDFEISEHAQLMGEMENLLPVINLMNSEWDAEIDSLDDSSLIFIREVVNEYAGELDMELVRYVMEVMIHNKLI
jgi:hypothetical protein